MFLFVLLEAARQVTTVMQNRESPSGPAETAGPEA
jgi:hypothetical protein